MHMKKIELERFFLICLFVCGKLRVNENVGCVEPWLSRAKGTVGHTVTQAQCLGPQCVVLSSVFFSLSQI